MEKPQKKSNYTRLKDIEDANNYSRSIEKDLSNLFHYVEALPQSAPVNKIVAGSGVTISPTTGIGDVTITATGSGTTDHAALSHLAYADAGHTGFQPTLVSGVNIKTINGLSILTNGDVSTLVSGQGMILGYVAKTADYTASPTDYTINCTANSFNIFLPTAVGITGTVYNIKNSGTGTITIDPTGSQTIDGNLTLVLNQWDSVTLQSTGSNWIII